MKITKKKLQRLIKEEAISPEQAKTYLKSKADSYRRQGMQGSEIELLLKDDFADDLGHRLDAEDFENTIRQLAHGDQPSYRVNESGVKITKKQLKRIVKEEAEKLKEMWRLPPTQRDTPAFLAAHLKDQANRGVVTIEEGENSDELYIMTGEAQGYTVKVLRRGR